MSSQTTEMFLRATGGAASIRVTVCSKSDGAKVYSNAGWRRQFKFDQPFILIGNHDRADLRLDSEAISRRQVYIQLLNGRLFATHLSNRVPTLWGATAQPAGWIDRDTEIGIGPYTLRFDWIVDPRNVRPPLGDNPLMANSFAGPAVSLDLKRGRPGFNKAIVDRVLTLVGSGSLCKLRMHSTRVSAIHCSLVRTAEGLWVVDLGSREGVQVNNATIRTALLADGDLLQIGGRRLRVRYGVSPSRTSETGPIQLESRDPDRPAENDPSRTNLVAELDGGNDEALVPQDEYSIPISALEPIIDKMNELQAQSYEQFQELMNAMIMTFGGMFMEHREFVGHELEKLEQLARALATIRHEAVEELPEPTAASEALAGPVESLALPLPPDQPATAAEPTPMSSPPARLPTPGTAPPTRPKVPQGAEFHIWLAQRVGELGRRRSSRWESLVAALRSKMPRGIRD